MTRIVPTMPINTGKMSILLCLNNMNKLEKMIIRMARNKNVKKTFIGGVSLAPVGGGAASVGAVLTFLNSSYTIKTAKKVINIKKIVKNI